MIDWSPLWISLKIAAISTFFTFFLGIIAARMVMQLKKLKFIADAVLSLPLVLPPTVLGFFLLIIFGRNSGIGQFLNTIGINIVFTWQGAAIAATVASFPIMYRTVRGAFEQLDTELLDAAREMGCGRIRAFFSIWIPLSWPGIASGLTLSFARALGEFGATIMIAGNIPGKTRTMSTAVYTAMQSGNRSMAFRWTAVILIISLSTLILVNFLTGTKFRKD